MVQRSTLVSDSPRREPERLEALAQAESTLEPLPSLGVLSRLPQRFPAAVRQQVEVLLVHALERAAHALEQAGASHQIQSPSAVAEPARRSEARERAIDPAAAFDPRLDAT